MQFELLHAMGYGNGDPETNGEAQAFAAVIEGISGARAPVIVDVGANRGDFSARALEVAGPEATIFAFEPSPSAFAELERRFAGAPRVRILPVGLSDRNEDDALLRAADPGSPHGSLYVRQGLDQSASERVALRRLDQICDEIGIDAIDYLKIDAEGHDATVLAGAGSLLDGVRIRAVQFEHGGTAPDARVFLRDFFDLLVPRYRIHRILPDGLCPLDRYSEVEEVSMYANYLALRAAGAHADRRGAGRR
jgi:FkbM family methyltransferase